MKDRIKKVLSEVLDLELSEVNDEFSQKTCGKWDSLNHLNIVIAFEEEFDISLEPEEISIMTNFKKIKEIIKRKRNEL